MSITREKGVIRPTDLTKLGLGHRYLSNLIAAGHMVRSERGLYRLTDYDITEAHSLVEAVRTQSNGVVCLLSALNFHEIGTQLPHEVWLSVPYGGWISNKKSFPIRTVIMRPPSYDFGIEVHKLEGVDVPIYNITKTVSNCFKFRGKIGFDVALEALRDLLRERKCTAKILDSAHASAGW